MKNPIRSLTAGIVAALLFPVFAHAEFPDRTVKIVVPFDAGGSIDTVARALAQRLNDMERAGHHRKPPGRGEHHRR
jgi:tripartite-type tricarboxylate transporter receptor subunit TctC